MNEVVVAAAGSAVVFGMPLGFLYFNERVKNIAREPSEKLLADYRHGHEQILAALKADNQRRAEEFGLFKRRQHAVYPKLYAELRKACDGFAGVVDRETGLYMAPDFSNWTLAKVRDYVTRRKIGADDASAAVAAAELGNKELLGSSMDALHVRANRRDAGRAFIRMRNYEALNELYLSQAVSDAIDAARRATALVSVYADEADEYRTGSADQEWRTKYRAVRDDMVSAARVVFRVMRNELQRGEANPPTATGQLAKGDPPASV